MNTMNKSLMMLIIVGLFGIWSCQEWDQTDPSSGNQQIEPAPINPSYSGCADPTIGKENDTYYIISTNKEISGIDYAKGLQVRTTKNLVDMSIKSNAAYVLSNVVSSWAANRLKELDGSVDINKAVLGQPCLRKVGDTWRLYYSVQAGTNASVIGYAVCSSLADGAWEDKGEVLSSGTSSAFKAMSPGFCVSADGTKHYMAFGNSGGGVYVTELDVSTGKATGAPVLVASRSDATVGGNPAMFYYKGFYHIIFTFDGTLPITCHIACATPMGTYTDFAGRNVIAIANFWQITRVLTNYQHQGGTSWTNVNSVDVLQEGENFLVVHHAKASGSDDPALHIRKMDWVVDSRRTHHPEMPVPAISPTRYAQENANDVTSSDIAGDWYYGTLWGHTSSGINDPMKFNSDGTYDGGSWDFNQSTHILHLHSTEWGNEDIYLYVSKGNDWDNNKALTIVASGINDVFADYPGAWMKKKGSAAADNHRSGVYDPAMAKESKFWIFSSNAAVDGRDYQKGLVVKSSDDLIFFDEQGYVLSSVVDHWAAARLKQLDATIADKDIVMGQPCIRKAGSEWRLYYSVQAGTRASVIGYATTTSLENQQWTDRGEILSSGTSSAYKAMSPSFCVSADGTHHYLAFGENIGGVYIAELNTADGSVSGTPVRIAACKDDGTTNQRIGAPELVYYKGYYHLLFTYNNLTVFQSASTTPMSGYTDFGNRNINGVAFPECRVLAPYNFEGGTKWTNTDGLSLCQDGATWYVVHHAMNSASSVYTLHARMMHWLEDSRMVTSAQPFPAFCPERYSGVEKNSVATADLIGTWHYGTLWYQSSPTSLNYMSNPMIVFNADGTYLHSGTTTGGTWDYNETSHILHMVSAAWGGENIYLYVNPSLDWDKNANTLVASGINDSFYQHPGVWMKKQVSN